jgi:hypothetical protein
MGSFSSHAQTSFSLGLETGTLHDRSHFRYNEQGLSGAGFGGYVEINAHLHHKGFIYSLGFGRYRHSVRMFELDRESQMIDKPRTTASSSESFVVPLTITKPFQIADKWDVRVGLGLVGMFPREPGDFSSWTSYNTSSDSSGVTIQGPDSTVVIYGSERRFNIAFETALQVAYNTSGPLTFYVNLAFQGHLMPVFESTFTFYQDDNTSTNGFSTAVNSYSFGIGAYYTFRKKERGKTVE